MADSLEVANNVIDLMAALKRSLTKGPCFWCGRPASDAIHEYVGGGPRTHLFQKQPYGYVNGKCVECEETNGGHTSDCAAVD